MLLSHATFLRENIDILAKFNKHMGAFYIFIPSLNNLYFISILGILQSLLGSIQMMDLECLKVIKKSSLYRQNISTPSHKKSSEVSLLVTICAQHDLPATKSTKTFRVFLRKKRTSTCICSYCMNALERIKFAT